MALVLVTPPAVEPLTLAEVKLAFRLDETSTLEDSYLNSLIKAARESAEDFLGRALIEQQWGLFLDDFPAGPTIEIPKPPLVSVTHVKYTDPNGVVQTLTLDVDYVVDAKTEPGWVILPEAKSWPTVKESVHVVEIQFKCGYGAAASAVPETIRLAMLHIVGHWYENREAYSPDRPLSEIPLAGQMLMWPKRFMTF